MDIRKKILLVEDEVIIAMNEAKQLESCGYETVIAASGLKALEAMRLQRDIDLVLMDIDLGSGMDGTEAAALILKERDIPVVFLSNHTEPEIVEKTETITSYGYVVKNSGITVLDASIKMAFRLFDARRRIERQRLELESANEELSATVEELEATNEELLRSQKDLEHSEARFRALIEHSADAISLIGADGSVLYDSPSYERIMGYPEEERMGKNTFDLVHPDDREALALLFSDLLKKPRVVSFPPIRVRHADGSWRWIEGVGNNLLAEPLVKAIVINFRDITERKEAEENLQLGYRRLMRAETVSNSGNWEFHLDTRIVYASEGARRIYGLGDSQWDIPRVQAIPLPEFRPMLDGALNGLLHEGRNYDVEFRIRHNVTGEIRDIHSVAEYDPGRKVVFGVIQDITERKQAELNAKEVEERLRLLSDNLTGGMVYQIDTGADGSQRRFTYISSSVERLHEVTAAEAEADAMAIYGQIFEEDAKRIAEREARAIETMTSFSAEIHFLLPSGRERWGLFTSTPRRLADNRLIWDGVEMDITERIRTAEELKKTTALLNQAFEQSPVPMALVSMPDAVMRIINPACLEFLGMQDEPSYVGMSLFEFTPTFIDCDAQGNPGMVADLPLARALRGEPTLGEERRIIRKDGTERWELVSAMPIRGDHGEVIAGHLIMADITERKSMEAQREEALGALRESEERYRTLVDNLNVGIFVSTLEGKLLQANPYIVAMGGYESAEEFLAVPAVRLYADPADRERLVDALRAAGSVKNMEMRSVRKDGSVYWISMNAVIVKDVSGNPRWIYGFIVDITDRKHAERLIEIERSLGMALSGAASLGEALRYGLTAAIALGGMDSGGVYLVDDNGGLNLEVHEGLTHGYVDIVSYYGPRDPRTHMIYRGVPIYVDSEGVKGLEENAAIAAALQALIKREDLLSLAMIPVCMMSEVLACINVASHTQNTIQQHTRMALESIGSHMASAILRIRAQEGLLERERRFRKYFDMPLVGVAITSLEKGWVEVNDRACAILGYSREELLRLTWAELTHPEDLGADVDQFELILDDRIDSYSMDKRFIRRDGTVVWTSLSVGCVRNPDRSVNYLIALLDDITERKRIEGELIEAMRQAEAMREKAETLTREKELLLREVHHRIKNNMSTMTSLLDLQARETSDRAVAAALGDARGRLMSMGVLYNKLYRGDLHGDIDMMDYLPSLADEIAGNFPGVVTLEYRIEDFTLDAKRVFPLGIILYELITNAMKYAFTGGTGDQNHMITVTASVKQGRAAIIVGDNGIGMPETADIEGSHGFGLHLVGLLTKQIGGSMRIERGGGTRFVLEFDV